jgi:hypothetical protein
MMLKKEHEQEWLLPLFRAAGIAPDADLDEVQRKMDAFANRAAPLARRWWKWIIFVQGLAVLIPLAWLRHPIFLPISWIGLAGLLTVGVFVSVNWWLRWRGMQKAWARSRLVAEVSRSLLSTSHCPWPKAPSIFEIVPALEPLQVIADKSSRPEASSHWKQDYLKNRIEDQSNYYRSKQREAERQRRQFSRWGTLMLDLALAFAFAGAVITLSPYGESWRRIFGDYRFEIVLGLAGVLAPLTLLLVQLLRDVQELNRRTARYAQQQQMLDRAKNRLTKAQNDPAAMNVVDETERQLLAEVLEWYFHAETAENFFLVRDKLGSGEQKIRPKLQEHDSAVVSFVRRTLGVTSIAGLFLLRVILGRIPWIVGSGAAALMWVAYHQPSDASARSQLGPLARLMNVEGGDWVPDQERLKYGCVIIVHGMRGDITRDLETKSWPKTCARKITNALGDRAPDICVVDWHEAAETAKYTKTGLGLTPSGNENLPADVAGVRSQAYEVGDYLAFRLIMMILHGEPSSIRQNQPLHLIGHSAGGFVVTRVAILLKEFNVAPQPMHVTMLDTPAPEIETTNALPDMYPDDTVDFYMSSVVGGRQATFQIADFSPKIHACRITSDQIIASRQSQKCKLLIWIRNLFSTVANLGVAHSYSYEWFMDTIDHPQKYPGEGFNRSPFIAKTSPSH